MNIKSGILFKLVLPIVLTIILFNFSKIAGIIGIIAYIGYLVVSGRPRYYAMAGKKCYDAGDMKGAAEWFEKCYKSGNANISLKASYAYILLKAGETDKAHEVLKPLLNVKMSSDEEITVKSNYALVLWKKNDIDGAVDVMERLLEKYKNTLVYENLGYFLMLKGDFNRALELNLEAYNYNSDDKIIMDNLGQNYFMLGDNDKSIEIYEKLMDRKPEFPEPYYYYGCALAASGRLKEGLEAMKKGVDYKFSPLSTIDKEQMENKIRELESSVGEV